jgi:hypothetical protein
MKYLAIPAFQFEKVYEYVDTFCHTHAGRLTLPPLFESFKILAGNAISSISKCSSFERLDTTMATITTITASKQQDLQSLLSSPQALDLSPVVGSVSPTIAKDDIEEHDDINTLWSDGNDNDNDNDHDDQDARDTSTMSRAVDDVLAYVDHFTFSSGKILPFTPKRSDIEIGNGSHVNVDTTGSMNDREHHHHPTTTTNNNNKTMPTTTALLDRTNTLFPDMTPFQSRKKPNSDARTPRSHVNIRRRLRPLSPAKEEGMETTTTTATSTTSAMGAVTTSNMQCERTRVQGGEPSEITITTKTTAAPETNSETESETSSQDESVIESESERERESETTNLPTQAQAQAPRTDPYQCEYQCPYKCRYEQQAWDEREKARNWARDLRTAVHHWVQQQKECLACERDQSTSSLQHQIIPRYQAALVANEQEVRNLHRELQQSRQHYQSVELQLYEVIQYQQGRLQQLELELEARKEVSSPTVPTGTGTGTGPSIHTGMPSPHQASVSPEAVTTVPPVIDTSATTPRSRIRRRSEDGTQFVTYGNGSTKEIHTNGTTVIRFPNGDVKTYSADNGTIAYHYAASKVTQVRKDNDGSNTIFEFPNGQVEQHWIDGRKIVSFPDGTTQRVAPDGSVETVLAEHPSSVRVEHSNGKKEWVHVATN